VSEGREKALSPGAAYDFLTKLAVMNRVERLILMAQNLAHERGSFFKKKGAGAGNLDTNDFMEALRVEAHKEFGEDFGEKSICGKNGLRVDFYFPDEASILEVALSLRNPLSEFEKDILKAIMAQEAGNRIEKLIFLSKPGAVKRCSRDSSRAIIEWAKRVHRIGIEIREL